MKKRIIICFFAVLIAGLTACGDVGDIVEIAEDVKSDITETAAKKPSEEAAGLRPYLMQSVAYNAALYGPVGTCETVYVKFDDKNKRMSIYEYGLYEEPDMIFPWDPEKQAASGEINEGYYQIRTNLTFKKGGELSGMMDYLTEGIASYYRFDPMSRVSPGKWQDDTAGRGYQWYDVRYSEANEDGSLDEKFDPESAGEREIWQVDTTGETTLWDWAVFMEGNSRISGIFLEEARLVADAKGYSMEGFEPGKEMMESYENPAGDFTMADLSIDIQEILSEPDYGEEEDEADTDDAVVTKIASMPEKADFTKSLEEDSIEYAEFGEYPKGKPIEWIVLDEAEGAKLLLSRYSLDFMSYNYENVEVTWETSDLRKWMNGYFYEKAFSESEKKHIQTVILENDDKEGGNDTEDKVFALSLSEVEKYFGVKDPETGEIMTDPETGDALIDTEALKTVCIEETRPQYFYEGDTVPAAVEDPDFFFLRTQGYHSKAVYFVFPSGNIGGAESAHWEHGVRPAIWIK